MRISLETLYKSYIIDLWPFSFHLHQTQKNVKFPSGHIFFFDSLMAEDSLFLLLSSISLSLSVCVWLTPKFDPIQKKKNDKRRGFRNRKKQKPLQKAP